MPRIKEFDYEEVLNKALDVFWDKGYSNTSIQDLVDHIGLGRGSIYNAFDSKHGLFLEVLDNYLATRDEQLLKVLKKSPVKASFKQYFLNSVDEMVVNPYNKGCFIVNAMTELAASDEAAKERLLQSERQLVTTYEEVIKYGVELGELSVTDTHQLASFLSNTMKGLRVISQVDNTKKTLEGNALLALTLLR